MSIKDAGKVCLFSHMSGIIKIDGKPAANVRLVRVVRLEESKMDEAQTDDNGYFEFPAAHERTITKFLPQEFVAKQDIDAHFRGQQIKIWDGVKRSPEENVESRGKPLIVECDLSSEIESLIVDGNWIHSRCKWDVVPDPPLDWSDPFDGSL